MRKKASKILLLTIAVIFSFSGNALALSAQDLVEIYLAQTKVKANKVTAWVNLSRAYMWLADENLDFSKYTQAELFLQKGLNWDSTNSEALAQLAQIKSANHKYDEAVGITSKILSKAPKNPSAWGALGDAFLELGEYKKADSCYKNMYKQDKEFYSLARLSRLAHEKGNFSQSVSFMKKAIQTGEREGYFFCQQTWANVQLGKLYLSRGKLEEALKVFEKALNILPEYLPALEHKGQVLALKGDFSPAVEIYEKVVEKAVDPEPKSALAKLYLAVGKKEIADSLLNSVAGQYGQYLQTDVERFNPLIAGFYLQCNINLEQALELAKKELETRQDIHAYDLLAWAYYKNGEPEKAWENISVALSKNSKDAEILYHAAVIAQALGKQKESKKYFSQATSINPLAEKMYAEN